MTSIEKLANSFRQWQREWDMYDNNTSTKKPKSFDDFIKPFVKMHKKEIIDAVGVGSQFDRDYLYGYHDKAEQYYQETFVSKGNDDTLKDYHIVDTNKMVELPKQDVDKLGNEDVPKLGYDVEKLAKEYDNETASKSGIKSFIAGWNKCKETLYTEEQVIEFVKWLASNWIPLYVNKEYLWEYDELDLSKIPQDYKGYKTEKQLFDIFQSLKQPKKD